MSPSARFTLTGAQIRGARAMVNITLRDLADVTLVDERTIRRAEKLRGAVKLTAANLARIREALEERGVVFLPANAEGEGLRLRHSVGSE